MIGGGRALRLRAPAALVLFLVATVGLTAVLSPPLLAALHGAGVAGATLEEVTFRTLELTAIVLTFPLLAVLGGGGRAAWGVPPSSGVASALGVGVLIGIASLLPVCLVLFALDVRVTRVDVDPDLAWWLQVTARAALPAAVVALTEELWFRGGLFTALTRSAGRGGALWAGAAIYAGAHFLDAPHASGGDGGGATQVLGILGEAVAAVFRRENLDSFTALLFAGLALGLVRLRLGHVALAIGIHAGWVLVIKVFKKFTYVRSDSPLRYLAGHYDDVIGWVAALSLGVLLLALWWWLRPREVPA